MPAKKKEITVNIDPDGNVDIDVEGYTDGSCRTATEALEKALGAVSNRQMKQGGSCNVKQTVKVK